VIDAADKQEIQRNKLQYNLAHFDRYSTKNQSLKYLVLISLIFLLIQPNRGKNIWLWLIPVALLVYVSAYRKLPPESFYTGIFIMIPYLVSSVPQRTWQQVMVCAILIYACWHQVHDQNEKAHLYRMEQQLFIKQMDYVQKDTAHIYFDWAGINTTYLPVFQAGNPMLETKNMFFSGTFAQYPLNYEKFKRWGITNIMEAIATDNRILVLMKAYDKRHSKEVDNAIRCYEEFVLEHYHLLVMHRIVDTSMGMTIVDFDVVPPMHAAYSKVKLLQ
jgi:hypothetical protein